jgi:hypothetical protein
MASTTEELTGQSDQLMSALGFFKTGDQPSGRAARAAAPRAARPAAASAPRASAASSGGAVSARSTSKGGGVSLKMGDSADNLDKDYERF